MGTYTRMVGRAIMVAALLVAVLALAAGAGGTAAYIYHSVDLEANQATFFYSVTGDGQPDVEEVLFSLQPCIQVVDAGTWSDGFETQSGGGMAQVGCDSLPGQCISFSEGIQGAGTVANYYFTIDLGEGGVTGTTTLPSALTVVIQPDDPPQKLRIVGPVCKPTAVTLASMSASAGGLPAAALGSLALVGLGALAALRRRSA